MQLPRVLLATILLAACVRDAAPPPFVTAPRPAIAVPVAPPPKPAWVARKVVPDAVTVPGGRVHTVKAGESGISIARAYGVEWSKVVAANHLKPPFTIEVGDKLLLPSKQVVAAMTVEQRAAAFRIDIDDLITGAEPAAPVAKAAATAPALKPLPAVTGPAPRFDWPLAGRVLASFGAKPGGRFNDGVDLKAQAGDPVRAAADGGGRLCRRRAGRVRQSDPDQARRRLGQRLWPQRLDGGGPGGRG